ncbi:hypothetical protein CD30_16005 [Ureibacillus massiliensis 4400831 = CIP 108448 = CCUG 49529]|uniref:DUF1835 domain-containing protein n=1 Tax=Ureibacillus massiliensis 4400831 = CIP 108448 = CCUG 49529 TaxID=1211035 RepID=A0A0A3IY54_9BACL|nr:DUF1835 domain-containing protein [Ureibacillus massiliensis]KGR89656.1 hypothetical protein CD30_16005 [Ureibacillus massiliensis 4400831 = CIP 108448 = CCUG 49529]
MFDEIKGMINHLEEKELKSLLLQFFLRMQAIEERKGYSEQQFFLDIKDTYNELLKYQKNQASVKQPTKFHTTHIVFGNSPTGSLRIALKELGLNQQEKIIAFSDLFSIGSIWHLHDSQGIANRYEWLRTHINIDDEVLFDYKDHFKQTVINIKQTPSHHPIIIWVGENAHEQTGLRFVLYLLKEKTNNIFIINTNEAYKKHFDRSDTYFTPLHMGELSSDVLIKIYEKEKNGHALTQKERKVFEQQWEQLCEDKEVLRIWDSHKIMSVPETFFDEFIINTVKKFHQKKKQNDFIKSARIIGEVIGHLDQYVGDQFIEYRVRRLIVDGIFDMEGIPKAMRYYSIKIR